MYKPGAVPGQLQRSLSSPQFQASVIFQREMLAKKVPKTNSKKGLVLPSFCTQKLDFEGGFDLRIKRMYLYFVFYSMSIFLFPPLI